MLRAIGLLIFLGLSVAAATWLADVGGTVEIKVGDAWIGTSFPIAVLLLVVLFIVLHGLLAIFAAVRRWPAKRRARRQERRREEGDAAVTRALVALAAGTAEAARLEVRRARGLLGTTPQLLMLGAEADRLAGREEAAAEAFRALAGRADSRFLGLRGLLRQAMQRGDWDAALALAKEAEATQPGAAWLREERAQLALRTQDWREALALSQADAPKAALALAAAAQETDPAKAAELERQAFAADPNFPPAVLLFAQRLREGGSQRRVRTVLEEAWLAAPMPELAESYMSGESDPLLRVKSAESLIRRNPTNAESRLLLATTALAAGLTGRARAELTALARSGNADRRAFLLLAELEEAENGETPEGRAAASNWLREAARAAPEPHWRCGQCRTEHERWAPVCSNCEAVGRITWTASAGGV